MSTGRQTRRFWRGVLLVILGLTFLGVLILPPARPVTAHPPVQGLSDGEGERQGRTVLLLNSYHHGLSWTDNIVMEVRTVLLDPERNPFAEQTELYVEYMDTKRLPMNDAVSARWRAHLAEKYATIPVDVIVVSDNDAYDFLRSYAGELFPETPVVFCGVNFFKDEDLAQTIAGQRLSETFTGVVEKVDFLSTIQLALRLHPNTRRFVVVNDATTTGHAVQQELEAVLSSFDDIEFQMLLDPTLLELEQLRSLPNDTLVLLVLLNRDGDGHFYTYEQSIDLLMQQTDRPIYGVWDFYLGRGLVGGMLTNAGLQGEMAGEMALQLLTGATVDDIPIVRESPNRFMFDYQQLRRFGIPMSGLPNARQLPGMAETVVLNRPLPFFQVYGAAVGVGLAVFVIAAGVVLLQRNHLAKQQAAAAALQEANAALEGARASMEAQVVARTNDLERRSRQFQIAAAVAREVASGALGGGLAEGDGPATGFDGQIPDTNTSEADLLLQRVARLISESFGFYHVGVFLVDEVRETAVLRAASSPGGRAMALRGHRLRIGGPGRGSGEGIVGYVAGRGEPRIASDVDQDEVWRETAELSATRSEMALPLRLRGGRDSRGADWVIGVLDIQSQARAAFRPDDVEVLEIVADQLALAIHTAQLFEESRVTLARMERAYGDRILTQWQKGGATHAYGFDGVAVRPLAEVSQDSEAGALDRLEVPIALRGEVVGTLVLKRDAATQPWLPEERALAATIGMQAGLSLESAQLLTESQAQAHRQQIQSEIVSHMRETLDMDVILQTALREMGQSLDIASIEVRMGGSHD